MIETNSLRSIAYVWSDILGELRVLGATDRKYDLPVRSDDELWERATRAYRAAWQLPYWVPRPRRWKRQWTPRIPEARKTAILAVLRRAYQSDAAAALIPMDVIVDKLRQRGHDSAYVEQTGGGCATIYVGPTWRDENGDERYAAAAGPGSFYGEFWSQPMASQYEFWIHRDDDGRTKPHEVPEGAPVDAIVDLIDAQVKASIGLDAVERAARAAAKKCLTYGERLSDDLCEALRDAAEPVAAGGDDDWSFGAAYAYELDEPLSTWAGEIPAGTYLRTVADGGAQAFAVTGDASAYVGAVEADFKQGLRP
ncbi:hypothetical protein [Actinoplanes sp. URMC 104]|uniref:hypothetical protein n=1 Tax=Actinoplanes sp. URMC 104 TaxID=3423409 RepID=UPI003F1E0922